MRLARGRRSAGARYEARMELIVSGLNRPQVPFPPTRPQESRQE